MLKEAVADQDYFLLEVGGDVKIPEGARIRRSRNDGDFPATPGYIKFYRRNGLGKCYFNPLGRQVRRISDYEACFMFVPEAVIPGKTSLVFAWVEGNCACALRKE